ncbi:relaxase/mobilization nuclease domain-containing protein [Alistipes finegoldii]|uniref:relaxase/mobilization nuclease domain-containing protein n=1 Tax=Alistipes finegoldii TaxID=214856 RepID=UPI00308084D6
MIGKIVTGKSFRGAVEYVLGKAKARLLGSDGVDTASVRSIIDDLNFQRKTRPEIAKAVGHISLAFHKADTPKLTDDRMRELAAAYMERMGIVDTQYIVARHNDTEHPHLHIVYNRVRYDKKLVLDKHERRRNVKACRELKLRFGLTFAKGKEHVKIERLRNADKIKYQIYEAIGRVLPECQRVADLAPKLKRQGIEVHFIHRGNDPRKEVQGMTFTKAGQCFKASQIDRKYSYGSLVKLIRGQIEKRTGEQAEREFEYIATRPLIPVEPIAVKRQTQKPAVTQEPRRSNGSRPAIQEPWDIDKFLPTTKPKPGGQQVQTREQSGRRSDTTAGRIASTPQTQQDQRPSVSQVQPSQTPRPTALTEHIAAIAKQSQTAPRPKLKPINKLNLKQTTSKDNDRPQVKTIPPRKRGRKI